MAGQLEFPLTAEGKGRSKLVGRSLSLLLSLALAVPVWSQSPATNDVQSHRLAHADVAQVATQLRGMLSQAGFAPEIFIDRDQNQLMVRGPEGARELAAQLIRTLDKAPAAAPLPSAGGQAGTVRGYPVPKPQLAAVVAGLQGEFGTTPGIRIAADERASQVIVIAPPAQQVRVAKYLDELLNAPPVERALQRVPVSSEPPVVATTYRLRNITASQFEASLTQLWGNGLLVTPRATEGTSLVQVTDEPGAVPVLRINWRDNMVEILAGGNKGRSWQKVVAALDQPSEPAQVMTQLVPLQRADPEKIRQAIMMIREAALRALPGETAAAMSLAPRLGGRGPANLVSMIFQETQPGDEPPAGQAPGAIPGQPEQAPGQPGAEPSEPGEEGGGEPGLASGTGMIGDVQIEYVPELGIIVVRGSKRDVERVQMIIDQIEKESLTTQPEVQVLSLKYTNSEAMTELVTTVYTNVYQPRQGSVSITALVKPNAILLVGLKENVETVVQLVAKLDHPVAPETQIKVFQLLNMSAVDAETYIRNFYGGTTTTTGVAAQTQQQPRGLSARVAVIADYRSNSLIVQASPRDLAEVADLLRQLDVEKTDASFQLKVFPLKNTMATDLQTVLQSALGLQARTGVAGGQGFQPGGGTFAGQNQSQTTTSKSVQIVGIDQLGNQLIESGLLTDVTVAADANSNALVVKAPKHSMGLIEALVEQLDKIPAAESQIKVFQIKNGDATNLTTMLQTLFGQQVTAGQVGMFAQTYGRTFGAGSSLQQVSAGESSLIPLNFGVDARTNSIIASGSRADLQVVEAILLKLDEGDLRQRKLIVYRLNNAPAQFVADALTQILSEQQQLYQTTQTQEFSLISQFEYIDQQVFVVPEVISNTLVVSATPRYFEQVTEVIEDLDRRPPMIMIQVIVALVRLNDSEELGAELGIQDSLLFNRGTATDGSIDPGFNFVNQTLGNSGSAESLATKGLLAGQAFSAFNVGRSSASEGFPGLVLSASNESLSILIRAMAAKSRVQILSRPQIMTMNNVPASVLVGQRVPQITDFQTTTTGTVNSVELVDTGISLGVIPRVTPDGLIIMDLEARDSKVGDPAEGIPIGVQDGVAIFSPIYDDITAVTTIAARSGQTVVFGGLIQKERTETFRGVPYLSQVPVLGHLFRYDTDSTSRSELLFFMTPHIVLGDEDIQEMNQVESERMSWCLADVVEMHGDPGFSAGRMDPWHESTPVIFPHEDPTGQHGQLLGQPELIPAPDTTLGPGSSPLMVPPNRIPGQSGVPIPGTATPPDKPFLVPSDQQQPGKPFLVPEDQGPQGKPFFDQPANPQGGIQRGRFYRFPAEVPQAPAGGVVQIPPTRNESAGDSVQAAPPPQLDTTPTAIDQAGYYQPPPATNPGYRGPAPNTPVLQRLPTPEQAPRGVQPVQYQWTPTNR